MRKIRNSSLPEHGKISGKQNKTKKQKKKREVWSCDISLTLLWHIYPLPGIMEYRNNMGNKSRGDLKEASLHSAPYKAHSVCNESEDQGLKQTSKISFLTIHRGSPWSPLWSCIWFRGVLLLMVCFFFFFPFLFSLSLFLSPTQDRVSTDPKRNQTNKKTKKSTPNTLTTWIPWTSRAELQESSAAGVGTGRGGGWEVLRWERSGWGTVQIILIIKITIK